MKVAIRCKALRQQFRTDDLPFLQNQAARGLVRENYSRDAGNDERISDAQQNGSDKCKAD